MNQDKRLATIAEGKESVRKKLVVTAKRLASIAKEKEGVRGKLAVAAEKLATTAKEKEAVRRKLLVTANTLRLKAKQLAATAKEKEGIRGKLALVAKQLALIAKEKENVRRKLAITSRQLAAAAKGKESTRRKLALTAGRLAAIAKEKESVRKKLVVTAKRLALATKEKEGTRKKLALTAGRLAAIAEEKENVRRRLAVTAKQLVVIAEEKNRSELRYQTLFESSGDAILLLTTDKIIDCNPTTLKIFGYKSNEDLLNKNIGEISPPTQSDGRDSRKTANEKIFAAFKEGRSSFEWTHRRANGTDFEASILLTRIDLPDQTVLQAIIRDITKEKELDKARDELISLASHQLRNPITAISWNLEMLLGGDKGPLSKEQEEILREVYVSSINMAELVGGFLDITKIESSGFIAEKGDVDLSQVSDSVLKELSGQVSKKKINIVKKYGSDVPHLNIGEKTARIILQNLLTNAIKYTPDGGTVEAQISKAGKEVSISVKDNGYGIPEGAKSKIFTKLFRAENIRDKEPTGTGLGLYLLKSLLDKLGGKIWFESKEGAGTTFYVNLAQ